MFDHEQPPEKSPGDRQHDQQHDRADDPPGPPRGPFPSRPFPRRAFPGRPLPDGLFPSRRPPDHSFPPRPFPEAFTACPLTAAARAVADEDTHALTDDDLLERLAQVEAARRSLEAASAHLAAELDARSVTDRRFGTRTRDYLSAQFRHDPRVASRLLRVGRGLRRLPVVDAALRDGRLTFEHAAVLAGLCNPRVAHVVEGAQAELVQLADVLRFDPWARQCRALVDLADADGGHQPSRDDRRLTLGWGLDGVLHLSGSLVGADAVAFERLVEAHANRLFRRSAEDLRQTGERCLPARAQLRADALVDLVRSASPAGSGTAPAVEATLLIPVDHPALRSGPGGATLDLDPGRVTGGESDLLLCDPVFRALVVDSLGVPLDLGRAVRFVTPDQRRALVARDGGCVFPGCSAGPSWTDAHHVIRVADGGPTDLVNLALLCRHHHGVVHRQDWRMDHVGGQRFAFTTPRGAVLDSQRHGRLRADSS